MIFKGKYVARSQIVINDEIKEQAPNCKYVGWRHIYNKCLKRYK
jgi:uncharacterized protein with HEPN domain